MFGLTLSADRSLDGLEIVLRHSPSHDLRGANVRQMLPATPTISVIVATRNRRAELARFLEVCVDCPTEPDWELIVVDNGNCDGTGHCSHRPQRLATRYD